MKTNHNCSDDIHVRCYKPCVRITNRKSVFVWINRKYCLVCNPYSRSYDDFRTMCHSFVSNDIFPQWPSLWQGTWKSLNMIYLWLPDGCLIYESAYRRKNDACYLHFGARSCWFIYIYDNTIARTRETTNWGETIPWIITISQYSKNISKDSHCLCMDVISVEGNIRHAWQSNANI